MVALTHRRLALSTTQLFAASDLYSVIEERDKALAELEHGKPGVSVVIPVYDQAEFLERAVWSLFEQTVAPIEIMVINDGSTDPNVERIALELAADPDGMKNGLRYFKVTNRGLPSARNTGLMLARGRAFLPLDADARPGPVLRVHQLAP
jgi:glycosyltransferase involved in cell wall biosynthesis